MPELAAITSVLTYTFMQLAFKHASAHPLVLTAWLGALLPVWAGLLALGLHSHLLVITLSPEYLALTGLWAAMATGSMGLLLWLIARFPLTELAAYRKLITILLTLALDLAAFGATFTPLKLAAIAAVLIGSITLPNQRLTTTSWNWRTIAKRLGFGGFQGVYPLGRFSAIASAARQSSRSDSSNQRQRSILTDLAAVALLCLVMTTQLAVYKQALHLQPDVLSRIFAAETLFALLSLAFFASPQVRSTSKHVSTPLLATVALLFFAGSVAEGFALTALPPTYVVTLGLATAALFSVHDLARGDLPATPRTLGGLALVISGFGLLAFTR